MRYKILVFFCLPEFCIARPLIHISGLLSSKDLNQNISQESNKLKSNIDLSGKLSVTDLSKVVLNQSPVKHVRALSGLLSANQLESVIQFMYAKQQQIKSINGMISSKNLDQLINWKKNKGKPRVNLSGLMVQNYLDPDYQNAFKILDNPILQQEYDAQIEAIQTYFKEYYLSPSVVKKTSVIDLPKVCCSDQNQNYTLCKTEQ